MKQIIGIFSALVLVPSMQVQAWVGGPWGNNSYNQNGDDGIYEAIATTSNGVGMYRWAVHNENPGGVNSVGNVVGFQTSNVDFGGLVGSIQPHVWYYRGVVYYGRCFGIVNSSLGMVSVTGNAANDGVDGSIQGRALNGVVLAGSGAPTIGGTGFPPGSVLGGVGNNKGFANSTFIARITQKAPFTRFKGRGIVSFNGIPDQSYSQVSTTLSEDLDGDGIDDRTTTTVHRELNGDSHSFGQQGHRVRFMVFGTQVSTEVNG